MPELYHARFEQCPKGTMPVIGCGREEESTQAEASQTLRQILIKRRRWKRRTPEGDTEWHMIRCSTIYDTVFVALKYLSTGQLSAKAAEAVEACDQVPYRKTI
jgi:hypothetical protein